MEHVRLHAEPPLRNPVLLYAFTGWNDAGDAASMAIRTMIDEWDTVLLGEIDSEPFTDFATVRPSVYLDDGRRRIRWPVVRMWSASLPGTDAIVLLGPEPALQWRRFGEQVLGVADRFGVSMAISLGALLADYPHTRPVQVIGTASDPALIERFDLRRSTYEGPTGIVGVLNDAFTAAGRPAASLWAAVPGYAAQLPSPKACEALLTTACAMVGTVPPTGAFAPAVAEYEARVAAMVAENEDLASYVARLEAIMDDSDDPDDGDDGDDSDDGDDTDGDATRAEGGNLVEEVERFLQQSGGTDPGEP
jgi:proteasome assembly chaperone (PAC2) family protein